MHALCHLYVFLLLNATMTSSRPKRLKTVVGAPSFIQAPSDARPGFGAQRAADLVRKAEANTITGLFTSDVLQVDPNGLFGVQGTQEPLIALAALSQLTQHIGLIATISTTYHHPYNLARLIATLDHASGGRAAWNAVTSSVGEENFGGAAIPTPEERYERAGEFIEVVHALFDANDPQAVKRNAGGGIAVSPQHLHPVHYRGKHFEVAGPLNVPQPPQGRPVLFQAGQSAKGLELGARLAEVVYTSQPSLEEAVAFVRQLREQAQAFGRAARLPLVMNSLHSVIGESEADVARRLREKYERQDPELGRLQVADMLGGGIDLSDVALDHTIPESLLPQLSDVRRRRGRAEMFLRYASEGQTLRQLIAKAAETGHWFVAGTPEQIADAVQARWEAGVLDVVSLHGLGNPDQEDLLLNGVLPQLRKRQLLDTEYVEGSFRANLGLPPIAQDVQRAAQAA